jgi:hypothetical protein
VLAEVAAERGRQDDRWGEQNHPHGTGPDWMMFGQPAELALSVVRATLNDAVSKPTLTWSADGKSADVGPPAGATWLLVFLEEVLEALVETDVHRVRAELVQATAVGAAWIEAIDRQLAAAERAVQV